MAYIAGLFKCPLTEVVCLGSWPDIKVFLSISLKASMTTFPRTDWIGSMTTATHLGLSCSNDYWVLISTEESQQPKLGWEWYHPTTFSFLWVCFNMSSISFWYTGSTDSTETKLPLWGMANTSTTFMVYSSIDYPNIRPMTSRGTPARQCLSIFRRASDEI